MSLGAGPLGAFPLGDGVPPLQPIDGTGASTFAALDSSGTGTVALTGAGDSTLGPLASAGAGTVSVAGDGASVFGPLTSDGIGGSGKSADGWHYTPAYFVGGFSIYAAIAEAKARRKKEIDIAVALALFDVDA